MFLFGARGIVKKIREALAVEQTVLNALQAVFKETEADKIKVMNLTQQLVLAKEEPMRLKADIEDLKILKKTEMAELETLKKTEIRQIEHLVQMKEEAADLKIEKRVVTLEKEYQTKTMELQTQYHDKFIAQMKEEKDAMSKVHSEILDRLPNVNAQLRVGPQPQVDASSGK